MPSHTQEAQARYPDPIESLNPNTASSAALSLKADLIRKQLTEIENRLRLHPCRKTENMYLLKAGEHRSALEFFWRARHEGR